MMWSRQAAVAAGAFSTLILILFVAFDAGPTVELAQTITIPPLGFVVREGKRIHGVLDVAAPLDAGAGGAVPGIVTLAKRDTAASSTPSAAALNQPQSAQQLYEDGYTSDYEEEPAFKPVVFNRAPSPVTPSSPFYAQAATSAPPPSNLVQPLPNFFTPPFQRWSDEDAAQHAYNLAGWRVRILQSKVRQAQLHRQLLELAKTHLERQVAQAPLSSTAQISSLRRRDESATGREDQTKQRKEVDTLKEETAKELKGIEKQMLNLAKMTARAVKQGGMRGRRTDDLERSQERAALQDRGKTRREVSALRSQVAALKRQVELSRDPLQDATSSPNLSGGVPAQVELWDKISGDLGAQRVQ
mmetsp:Transcript_27398/g.56074  ORF Transcript_27398/g.56074 Transcript_27398/m.56074 type:complete len:358 (+) Transcript_27398:57-1130(+)|eukprot:CAMPEP_0181314728 /NCGR_PEP_ID=MMETSP1101-20121128/14977_1 /TAXON_ID=46948 /ORGANISM="Rhodomonas abbreviata, Strain Caron Lab Isolate" /LENGTH=357 /DNA_ID=CAMNT_0023421849 /DNA_START=52 /DNA_END=1125 /DNA_ORIENTATION=+